jgi:hypothetical protein
MLRPSHVVILVLLAGCAKSRDAEPASSGDDDIETLYCAYLSACAPAWLSQFPGGTEEACVAVTRCSGMARIPFVPSCEEGEALQCKLRGLLGSECEAEPAGEGERCGLDGCEPGLACDLSSGCPVCAPALAVGDACATECGLPSLLCGAGAFCDPELLICQPLRGAGEACRMGAECVDRACTVGKCGPLHQQGEPCRVAQDCEGYLTCRDGACGPLRALGETCGDVAQCQPGLLCAEGQCEQALCVDEAPRVGSRCPSGFFGCGQGLYCDARTDRCAEVRPLGEACTMPFGSDSAAGALGGLGIGECGPDGYCSAESRCAPRRGEGESCAEAPCHLSLSCVRQHCDQVCGCGPGDGEGPSICQKHAAGSSCE